MERRSGWRGACGCRRSCCCCCSASWPGPVTHLLDPNELFDELLLPLVSLSVAVILFEGGLTLNFRELRAAKNVVRNLVSVGVLTTWVVAAAAAHLIVGLELRVAVLLGAILVVTGPTVIMPLLRQVRAGGLVGPVLKWEGIVSDPLGALVTVLAFEVLFGGQAPAHLASSVLKTVIVGGGLGVAAAAVLAITVSRFWVPEFLHNGVALALVLASFAVSNMVQSEAGLLAVTVMGIALANQRFADVRHVLEFKENLRVLLISALFIVLAARLSFADLRDIGPEALLFVAVLMFVARPLGVAISTARSKLNWRERVFLMCVAPRGIVAAAVAAVFAIRLRDIPDGTSLVPLTFLTIVATVLIYGLSAAPIAHWLKLADANPQGVLIVGAHSLARAVGAALKKHGFRVMLVDMNYAEVRAARMDDLPAYHGSILGEHTLEELDLGGIGRLLAMTGNDEVNVLAVQRFRPIFGRALVYQLAPFADERDRASHAQHLFGRRLFRKEATYTRLQARIDAGDVIKATKLSESFDYKAFQMEYSSDAVPLFIVKEAGRLSVVTADQDVGPKAGQTLVSLVTPKPERDEED